ncbi:MAG: bifunctional nicotinamidase/pyrazinamidase [Gammaproteobacteria bacterium]|nr:bifunctional nicotinamidase/pyrazinamidase [Gammaproteobacteria bacterium]
MQKNCALLLIDLQNDFCKGGNLAVPLADEIIPLANQLQSKFDVIIATQDWHPSDHSSFVINNPGSKIGDIVKLEGLDQIIWPVHCVQQSRGAALHADLNQKKIKYIVYKGTDRTLDSYSAFFDNAHQRSTGLAHLLNDLGIQTIYMMGLATDYCVKYSALDAVHLGFHVVLISDACRGVELNPGDIENALRELQLAGIQLIKMAEI